MRKLIYKIGNCRSPWRLIPEAMERYRPALQITRSQLFLEFEASVNAHDALIVAQASARDIQRALLITLVDQAVAGDMSFFNK